MRLIFLISTIVVFVSTSFTGIAYAGESGWMSVKRLGAYSRKIRRNAELPTKIECRNASTNKNVLKVEVLVKSTPNAQNRDWALYALDGEYRPGKIKQTTGWKKVSGNVLVSPASGKRVHCSIYHSVNKDTFSTKAPSLWIKVGAGYRALN